MKRIEDFYLEEVILFQIQQHIMELGESDKLLQAEKEAAAAEARALRKKCWDAERAIDKAKAQRMSLKPMPWDRRKAMMLLLMRWRHSERSRRH